MRTKIIISFIAMTFLWSCSSTMKYTWTKEDYQGKDFNRILVFAEAQTEVGRITAENIMVDVLTKEGINATNSLQVFSVIEDTEGLSEDEIESRILSGGYDGVLITTLVDVSTREVREGGGSYYQPGPYRYGRYMHGGYMHMRQPEYYRQEETFVLETKLFDTTDSANKQAVVWSGQSELTDPSSAESALKGYSKKLVKTLVETGLIQ